VAIVRRLRDPPRRGSASGWGWTAGWG